MDATSIGTMVIGLLMVVAAAVGLWNEWAWGRMMKKEEEERQRLNDEWRRLMGGEG